MGGEVRGGNVKLRLEERVGVSQVDKVGKSPVGKKTNMHEDT